MDKKILARNTLVLSAAAVLIGGGLAAQAATDGTTARQFFHRGADLEQGEKGQGWQNLSEEDKAKLEADREARQQAAESRRAEVDAAISANDYQAWVAAVGADSPMAQKVTAANFSRFSEAHKLMAQAREIMAEIGLEQGPGMGHGQGRGMGLMMRHK